jgi:hypothetical protein
MKPNFLHIVFSLATAVLVASCSSEEPVPQPDVQPNLPGNGDAHVKTIVHSGNIQGVYDWNFEYKDMRLTAASGILYNPINVPVQYSSYLTYGKDSITIRNTSSMVMKVTLNADNLMESLLVNKDEYRFTYSDGRLVAWQKTINDMNFGAEASHASARIEYKNGNISKVTYSENNDAPIYYRCTPSSYNNVNGLLPETISKQFGCFGFEHLYYAGLLGKPTQHLLECIEVDYPSGMNKEDYKVDFKYSVNKLGQIQLCTFVLDDEAVSVNYTY